MRYKPPVRTLTRPAISFSPLTNMIPKYELKIIMFFMKFEIHAKGTYVLVLLH